MEGGAQADFRRTEYHFAGTDIVKPIRLADGDQVLRRVPDISRRASTISQQTALFLRSLLAMRDPVIFRIWCKW